MLDQFRIVGPLGRGGMGVVYEADDTLLERRVAIKTLPDRAGPALPTLLREARAAARLDHPNVVRVHHVGRWDGGYYLVLELVRGGSLQSVVRSDRPLPWPDATRAVADACRGLAAAHASGMVHRDVKPGNLMRGESGRVKVADFGLVRGDGLTVSASPHVCGTPHFMSPEQCRAEPADARSDLYALGATYYCLLTGRVPFPAPTPVQAMFAHCTLPVPDPRAHVATLPAGCTAVVRRAMAKEPAARFQTADEMLTALLALIEPPSIRLAEPACDPAPAAPTGRVRPPNRVGPRRRPWLVPALVALGVAGLAIGGGRLRMAAPGLWDDARTEGRSGGGDRGTETWAAGGPRQFGTRAAPGDPVAAPFDPVIPVAGRTIAVGGAVRAVAVSADGELLAAGTAASGAGVKVWELRTGRPVCGLAWGEVYSLNFSTCGDNPPARYLLAGCAEGPYFWIPGTPEEGRLINDWEPGWGAVGAVAANEGRARAIGYSSGGEGGRVIQYDWAGTELSRISHPSASPVHQIAYAPADDLIAIGYANGDLWVGRADGRNAGRDGTYRTVPPAAPPALAFAPDRPELAVGKRHEIFLRHSTRWEWENRILAPDDVRAVAYRPDGRYLAAVGDGGMVTLWDARPERDGTHETPAHRFTGHRGEVSAVAWAPDGRTLVTGGLDGTVRLWDLDQVPR